MFIAAEIDQWNEAISQFISRNPTKLALEFTNLCLALYGKKDTDKALASGSRILADTLGEKEFPAFKKNPRFKKYLTKILSKSLTNFFREGGLEEKITKILRLKLRWILMSQKSRASASTAKTELMNEIAHKTGETSPSISLMKLINSLEMEYQVYADLTKTRAYVAPIHSLGLFLMPIFVCGLIYQIHTLPNAFTDQMIFNIYIVLSVFLISSLGIYRYLSWFSTHEESLKKHLILLEKEFNLTLAFTNAAEYTNNSILEEPYIPYFQLSLSTETPKNELPKPEKGKSIYAYFKEEKGMAPKETHLFKSQIRKEQEEAEQQTEPVSPAESLPEPKLITWQNTFNNRQTFVKEFVLKKGVLAYAYLQEDVLIKEMGSDLLDEFAALIETKTKSAAPTGDEGIKPLYSQFWGYFDNPKNRFPLNYELKLLGSEGRILGYSIVPDISDHRSPLVVFCVYQKTHQKQAKIFKIPPLTLSQTMPSPKTESNNNNANDLDFTAAIILRKT